jgi:serine/threonine-protein kinase RsbT
MTVIRESLVPVLEQLLPRPAVRSILATLPTTANAAVGTLDLVTTRELLGNLETGLRTFGNRMQSGELDKLKAHVTGGKAPKPSQVMVRIGSDHDVLTAQRAAQLMLRGFFGATDCVRLTTVISELARNIYMYATTGELKLSITDEGKRVRLDVVASDRGPGIANLDVILSGSYLSKTGLGKGLLGAKRIFDELHVDTGPGRGTTVRALKRSR